MSVSVGGQCSSHYYCAGHVGRYTHPCTYNDIFLKCTCVCTYVRMCTVKMSQLTSAVVVRTLLRTQYEYSRSC